MNRRKFGQMVMGGLGTISLYATMGLSSCGTVFAKIIAYMGVGVTAFQSVVNLLQGAGAINPVEGSAISVLINLVKAGFADLSAVVTQYDDAPAADKTTLAQKVAEVLSILQGDIQKFWTGLSLPSGNLASTVAGLLGIILSTLAGFGVSLPAVTASTMALPNAIPVTPVKRTPSQFKKEFNAAMSKGGYPEVKF